MICVWTVLVGYLIGSLSAAIPISRWWSGQDIRTLGDANAGTANVARHLGLKPAALVAIVDIAKGGIAILTARAFSAPEACVVMAGVAAVLGHRFPIYFRFRGGRGLATTLGALLALVPRQMLMTLPLYGMIYLGSRGSGILATLLAFPVLMLLIYWDGYDAWIVTAPLILAFTTAACSLPEVLARWQKTRDARRLLYDLLHPRVTAIPEVTTVVMTDSVASLPPELCQREGIRLLPMAVILPQGVVRDGVDIDTHEYYRRLRSDGLLPKTSAPAPGEYLQAIRQFVTPHQVALILTPPAELTQCFFSASLAAQMAAEEGLQARVVDTRLAGPAQGLLALAAARLAASGASAEQIIEALPALIPRIGIVGVLDTLSFVAQSGRVSVVNSLVESALRLYPVLSLYQGHIRLEGVERTRRKAIERMIEWLQKHLSGKITALICFHADAPDEGQALYQRLVELLRPREHYLTELTPVIGAHAGPGVVGAAWWQSDE
ncbi:glycerol-3-phosphate acyltransferase [uncultured Thermanaerothrix sp.]|uniref:glycerol-3-phosphate acyltransferase n=1 Tax=uncultured Thermanaerothrix sp. TaxID=1195149 RepID=UPI0026387650|nr:glycerol-3-phosphate acyltransferase [uncultured Thermanaerothrix sp.]